MPSRGPTLLCQTIRQLRCPVFIQSTDVHGKPTANSQLGRPRAAGLTATDAPATTFERRFVEVVNKLMTGVNFNYIELIVLIL